jgi:mercuric reductase
VGGRSRTELTIKTADELVDPALEARLGARRARRQDPVLQAILQLFLDRGGPIGAEAIAAAVPGRPREAVLAALADLDAEDLILLGDAGVELAYPFATGPNHFMVVLADGRLRYACCAIDALGIPPMIRQPAAIRSRCYHCEAPLDFPVDATGPGRAAEGVMVWIGERGMLPQKVCTSL